MKKSIIYLIVLSLLFVFLTSCSDNTDEGKFEGKVSENIDLENNIGAIAPETVIDEKLALEIGNAVIKTAYGEDVIKDTKFLVYEIKGKNIFVVSRLPKEEALGGGCSVAISKTNGEILKIWAGE